MTPKLFVRASEYGVTEVELRSRGSPRTTDLRPWLWESVHRGSEHSPRTSLTPDATRLVRASSPHLRTGLSVVRGKSVISGDHGIGALPKRWKDQAEKELHAYFTGRATSFSAPCDLRALPAFTRAVLEVTAKIPYGEVRSYEWVARALGKPKAARAVGNALARNPVPIIIPCHRIVRNDGSIGGFALGSAWKKRLLALEEKFAKRSIAPERSASRRRTAARRKF